MILVDANLLLYAENSADSMHPKARQWWQEQLSGGDTICLPWVVLCAFIRIGTSPRAFPRPLSLAEATERVDEWLRRPMVRVVNPTEQHWPIFRRLLEQGKATGNLVTDAHVAALAIEHGCDLCSTDADFARFPKLKWRNPLAT